MVSDSRILVSDSRLLVSDSLFLIRGKFLIRGLFSYLMDVVVYLQHLRECTAVAEMNRVCSVCIAWFLQHHVAACGHPVELHREHGMRASLISVSGK